LRKITLEINFSSLMDLISLDLFTSILSLVDKIEAKSFLKIDYQKGEKIAIVEFTMKGGHVLDEIPFPPFAKILNVLAQHENQFLVLIQIQYDSTILREVHSRFSPFGIEEIFYETPAYIEGDRLVFSIFGEKKALSTFLTLVKKIVGDLKILRIQNYTYNDESILSELTDRQKEILIKAKQSGYYEIPRKISTMELAKEFGISKTAILEHLRKAERKIMLRVGIS
jgi:predicted DNA binding protein